MRRIGEFFRRWRTVAKVTGSVIAAATPELLANPNASDAERRAIVEFHAVTVLRERYPDAAPYLPVIVAAAITGARKLLKKRQTP